MNRVHLGLGANLGDRRANIAAAVEALSRLPGTRVVGTAGLYETEPVGGPEGQGTYLNSAAEIETEMAPRALLRRIHEIERALGRVRDERYVRWGPRALDIDILLWDGVVMDEPDLVIPHPRLAERAFALRPLVEIDAGLLHPATGKSVGELLRELDARE